MKTLTLNSTQLEILKQALEFSIMKGNVDAEDLSTAEDTLDCINHQINTW